MSGSAVALRVRSRGEGPTRVGITAGKRLDGRAVVRNRIRRRLREALRLLPVGAGYDVVVLARPRSLTLDSGQLRTALQDVFGRAGLMAGDDVP